MAIPSSTYRLQLSGACTFGDARALVPYLTDLGVGALYASPLLESGAGSDHGYDVVDPTRVSAERGGDEGRSALVAAVRAAGLGLLVDIVPNHVGVAEPQANPWWWDVLRHGRESRYARHFDVDWDRGPILMPLLADDGDGGAAALGDLRLDGPERLAYFEHVLPVAPGTGGGTAAEVHERQHYRLVSWRRGAAELTYRKFFDVATLAAVRVEDPDVFESAHALVLRWLAAGEVDGLRIDHPDGLADPTAYLRRLRASAPGAWLLVEKILHVGEALPASWPVDGTTGYDALREICGLFVDPDGEAALTALAGEDDLAAISRECRRLVASTLLVSEVRRIARLTRVPQERAEAAVAELLASFPVYRSYLPSGRATAESALAAARDARPDLGDVFDAIAVSLFGEPDGEFAVRLQQTSGMVMAKGVEDTAFYRYNRLVALNEVGGDPARFGVPAEEFHAAAAARHAGWPATMTTLSTHDTKRSEDVRARIAVLSEAAEEFAAAYRRWSARLAESGRGIDEPSLDLLAWQTLVGAWPIPADRLRAYLGKAAKEAKVRTTHTDPDPAFDAAVAGWADAVLGDEDLCAEVAAFVERIRVPGWSNSLGQKLLQLTGPGVPDVYQGTELWDNSLVDPDNRRPVDFGLRRDLLARLDGGWLPPLDDGEGAAKLLVTSRALRLRRDRPALFDGYLPLSADGPAAGHAVAFARSRDLVAVATRLPVGLDAAGGWRDTVLTLPGRTDAWTDVLTGTVWDTGVVPLAGLLGRYPVALLARD